MRRTERMSMNWREPTLSACTRKARSCSSRSLQSLSLYTCLDLRAAAEGILFDVCGVEGGEKKL